jgi:ABC-type transporter Mla MlaB component
MYRSMNLNIIKHYILSGEIMDDTDVKILSAINEVSPKTSISPVKVNEILKLDATEFGTRLKLLKKSGHVDIMISEYPSSLTLPNSISKVFLTELGRKTLIDKK